MLVKKGKEPLKIQTKTQMSIALAMLIGFTAVTLMAYFVLNKVSKESLVSTMNISIADIETNLVSDVNSDYYTELQNAIRLMKQNSLQKETTEEDAFMWGYDSLELYNNRQEASLNTIAKGRGFAELILIREDGTIKYSTNSYIKGLNNISELDIIQHDPNVSITSADIYKYIPQLDGYYKCVYCNYYYSNGINTYYVLGMYNEEQYTAQLKISFEKGLAARHLGENGYIIVTDSDNTVISSATALISEKIDIDLKNLNNISMFKLDSESYYSYIVEFEGFNIIGLMNKTEWDASMKIALFITAITEIIVFLILYFMLYIAISNSVIQPLKRVNLSLDRICQGNLDEKVAESSSIELDTLSKDINSTVDSLKEYMGKEAKLIQKELNFAKEIQYSVLPVKFPSNDKFEIYALMETAKEVGGDFYDFYLIDENHLFILIADVSGKGIPAALFMMQAKSIIKNLILEKLPLDTTIINVNKQLCENNVAQMFVTCWCGILDLNTGLLQFVNAGHNPPVIKQNGNVSLLKSKVNFVLAGMDDANYKINTITLEKNDEILLYTDGVTEATSTELKLWGEDNLLNVITNSNHNNPKELCEEVLKDVKTFTIGAEQSDDITMLSIKYIGK